MLKILIYYIVGNPLDFKLFDLVNFLLKSNHKEIAKDEKLQQIFLSTVYQYLNFLVWKKQINLLIETLSLLEYNELDKFYTGILKNMGYSITIPLVNFNNLDLLIILIRKQKQKKKKKKGMSQKIL